MGTDIFNKDLRKRIVLLLLVFFLFSFAEELPTTPFGVILTEKHVTPSTQTWYYTAAFATFSCQPLFAIVAQFLSIYTCCKLKFFATAGLVVAAAMYILIGVTQPSFAYLFLFTVILNIGLSFANAILDGMSAEVSNHFKQQQQSLLLEHQQPLLVNKQAVSSARQASGGRCLCCRIHIGSAAAIQSLSYFCRSLGSLLSSAMLIGLSSVDNYRMIVCAGVIYALVVLPFLWLLFPDSRTHDNNNNNNDNNNNADGDSQPTLRTELQTYMGVIGQLWRCLLFVFLLNVPPSFNDVFYIFIYSRAAFVNAQFRVFKFMSLAGSAIGGLVYFVFIAKYCTNRRRLLVLFVLGQCVYAAFGLLFLPLSDLANAFETDGTVEQVYGLPLDYAVAIVLLLATLTSSLVLLPQLTLAADMSPLRLETAVYACFVGVAHLGQLCSSAISSALLHYLNIQQGHWQNLSEYIAICSVSSLLPLVGLFITK